MKMVFLEYKNYFGAYDNPPDQKWNSPNPSR